jgi:hypothetical protein
MGAVLWRGADLRQLLRPTAVQADVQQAAPWALAVADTGRNTRRTVSLRGMPWHAAGVGRVGRPIR